MCWNNKTQEEIDKIHKKSGETFSKRVKSGDIIPSFSNRKHAEETKNKIRVSTVNYLESKFNANIARYSSNGCKYIESLNEKMGWNLQHAENGGEYKIDGYFLDGYDKERNIAFEYDEPRHYEDVYNNVLKEKDIKRQDYIIEKLNCRFFRYNEKLDLLYEVTK